MCALVFLPALAIGYGAKGSGEKATASATGSPTGSTSSASSAVTVPRGDDLGASGPLSLTVDGKPLAFKAGIVKSAFAAKTLRLTLSANLSSRARTTIPARTT